MRSLLTLCMLLLLVSSCSKSEDGNTLPDLTGQWAWLKTFSDGGPQYDQTPQSTGRQETQIFSGGNHWDLQRNGAVASTGTYTISPISSNNGSAYQLVYHLSGGDSVSYFQLLHDTLRFSTDYIGAAGGGSKIYKKLP